MIPHSRKDASGRSQLSKAEGELAFKLWQKGDKGGRGGRGQKEEGGRIEAKKRTWEAFKKCYSYKLTAITIHQPFPLIISLLFKRFIYLIRYLIFINHIKSGGVPDYLRAVHTHTHTHTHTLHKIQSRFSYVECWTMKNKLTWPLSLGCITQGLRMKNFKMRFSGPWGHLYTASTSWFQMLKVSSINRNFKRKDAIT